MNFLRSRKFLTFHLKFRSPLSCKFLSNPPFYFEFSLSRSFLGVSYKLFDKHFYFTLASALQKNFLVLSRVVSAVYRCYTKKEFLKVLQKSLENACTAVSF